VTGAKKAQPLRSSLAAWGRFVPLALILAVAAALRLYGLDWDQGQWLHPDERQIFFVVLRLGWPTSLAEALSPDSPLNPGFFAYGSLPFYLLKVMSAALKPFGPALRNPDNLHLAGRSLATLFDLGTVYLTYRLARTMFSRVKQGPGESEPGPERFPSSAARMLALLAAAFVGLAVLHVQNAHFYTADTLLTFFVLLALTLAAEVAQGGGRGWSIALGIAFGLALATKVSALPLIFVLFVAYHSRPDTQGPAAALRRMILPLIVALLTFFVVQPYALIDWRTFLEDTIREVQIARGSFEVPYTIQYAGTLPLLYSIWQTALWGLALPLGVVAWGGVAASLVRWLRHGLWTEALLLAWAGPYLALTGLQYAKHLRYMLPLAPLLAITAASVLAYLPRSWRGGIGSRDETVKHPSAAHHRRAWLPGPLGLVAGLLLISAGAYVLFFDSIYASPHSWVTASDWIYRNLPAGSTVALEHWDTPLPLEVPLGGGIADPAQYAYQTLSLYDEPDGPEKWQSLVAGLSESDVLIVASRRLYGSIPRLPERYPVASRYYDLLFSGELGFELAAEFTRGPAWLNPPLPPLPGAVPSLLRPDESFVVYDHPRALIFRNMEHLPAEELYGRVVVPGP
jgi:4-amino-4-deoxy-L-arabinose transferase-like glycosyltransferase